jgi:hypothetical protein
MVEVDELVGSDVQKVILHQIVLARFTFVDRKIADSLFM